jgi:hypothetical protein
MQISINNNHHHHQILFKNKLNLKKYLNYNKNLDIVSMVMSNVC